MMEPVVKIKSITLIDTGLGEIAINAKASVNVSQMYVAKDGKQQHLNEYFESEYFVLNISDELFQRAQELFTGISNTTNSKEGKPMKAHINGITIEGTPQEIMEYQRLQNKQTEQVDYEKCVKDIFKPWMQTQKNPLEPPFIVTCGTAEPPDYLKFPTIISFNYADE